MPRIAVADASQPLGGVFASMIWASRSFSLWLHSPAMPLPVGDGFISAIWLVWQDDFSLALWFCYSTLAKRSRPYGSKLTPSTPSLWINMRHVPLRLFTRARRREERWSSIADLWEGNTAWPGPTQARSGKSGAIRLPIHGGGTTLACVAGFTSYMHLNVLAPYLLGALPSTFLLLRIYCLAQ